MKKKFLIIFFSFICVIDVLVAQTFESGQKVFTKKTDTPLLSEPRPLAEQVGKIDWGVAIAVSEVQGRWLKVSSGGKNGWVFSGNVSATKPPAENKNDFLPTTAGETTAATAARPLSDSSKKFAKRKNCEDAVGDVEWLEKRADTVSSSEVIAYMKQNKLGEYMQ